MFNAHSSEHAWRRLTGSVHDGVRRKPLNHPTPLRSLNMCCRAALCRVVVRRRPHLPSCATTIPSAKTWGQTLGIFPHVPYAARPEPGWARTGATTPPHGARAPLNGAVTHPPGRWPRRSRSCGEHEQRRVRTGGTNKRRERMVPDCLAHERARSAMQNIIAAYNGASPHPHPARHNLRNTACHRI